MKTAAQLLRELNTNPPGRRGHYWETNRQRLLVALEKARLEVCAYAFHQTCDCKHGLVPGLGVDPKVISDEHTGCPELRAMIRALIDVDLPAVSVHTHHTQDPS